MRVVLKKRVLIYSWVVIASFVIIVAPFSQTVRAQDPKSTKDSVYTAAQAKRGEAIYLEQCSPCHRADLSGAGGPSLAGMRFMGKWETMPLWELFDKIIGTMPRNSAGNLTRQQVVDLISFIHQSNKLSAGQTELASEDAVLSSIILEQ